MILITTVCEFNKFNRSPIMLNHCNPDTITGWIGRRQYSEIPCGKLMLQILNNECNVRHCLYQFTHRTIIIKPHPLYSKMTGWKSGHIKLELRKISFTWHLVFRRDSQVMILPPPFSYGFGKVIVFSGLIHIQIFCTLIYDVAGIYRFRFYHAGQ